MRDEFFRICASRTYSLVCSAKWVKMSPRSGRSLLPNRYKKRIPRIIIGPPTKKKSKSRRDSAAGYSVWSTQRLLTIRFVEVPIRVAQPPNIAAYERGMSSFDGKILFLRLQV